jgi:hypothetical protein
MNIVPQQKYNYFKTNDEPPALTKKKIKHPRLMGSQPYIQINVKIFNGTLIHDSNVYPIITTFHVSWKNALVKLDHMQW